MLEFEADREQLRVAETHAHPPEIWQLAPHPQDASLLATVHNEGVRTCMRLAWCSCHAVQLVLPDANHSTATERALGPCSIHAQPLSHTDRLGEGERC